MRVPGAEANYVWVVFGALPSMTAFCEHHGFEDLVAAKTTKTTEWVMNVVQRNRYNSCFGGCTVPTEMTCSKMCQSCSFSLFRLIMVLCEW